MKFINRTLGHETYARVWGVIFGWFSLRIHQWLGNDDSRAFHNHPYWFVTLVIKGGYTDVSDQGHDVLRMGSIRARKADHWHTVQDVIPGTITLLITGAPKQRWGFRLIGQSKVYKRDKYFAELGHHAFNNVGKPTRLRPDGSKIDE